MDKEYLENYLSRENEEYEKLVVRKLEEGSFDFNNDKYPLDSRFMKLQHPITDNTIIGCTAEDRWVSGTVQWVHSYYASSMLSTHLRTILF